MRCCVVAVWQLASVVTLLLSGCRSPKAQSSGPPPAVPVSVAVATQEAAPVEIRAVGTVEASVTVQVKSQIAGQLIGVRFTEGADVNQGDLLFEIDPRPFREALRQSEAAVAKDRAQLRQAEANLARDLAQSKHADTEAARYEALANEGVVSRTQHDQVRANSDALRAAIRADQAAIESARASLDSNLAAVDRAKLDLGYCEIRAPVSGRTGNLLVHAGNLVRANGEAPLVVINKITPIFAACGVPAQHLPAIRRNSGSRKLPVQASPQNDPDKAVRGVLSVIDNTVDPSTGLIRLKAVFDNRERVLWPGQFVNISLLLATRSNAIMVQSEAVQTGQAGQFVYVVKSDKTVELRNVTAGPAVGAKVVIEKGLAPGETVVTDGHLRLFPGARIEAVPAAKIDSQRL